MYFVNQEHDDNFRSLLEKYPVGQHDPQYGAGFYVVAHPILYNHCNRNPVSDGHGPFDWYFDELENPPRTHAGLSGGYSQLVKLGLNLYNNHNHGDFEGFTPYLALGTWGDELFKVFVQACQIRRGRNILPIM